MNSRAFHLFSTVFPALLMSATLAVAQTPKKTSPTSKLYVAETTGESQIDLGDEKIQLLEKNGIHAPEGATIESKAKSTDSLVLSNGTALYVGPDTRFEVKKFMQEPFSVTRTDLDLEPSISQTFIRIVQGTVGICTSKLVAGSSMTYQTPQATINVRGRRLLIETDVNETRVALLEGDITVIGNALSSGETLRPGQQAVVRKAPDDSVVVTIRPIPKEDLPRFDELVSLACISRSTVYFEAVERKENGTTGEDIVPVRTTPAQRPTEFTVSPARIHD